MLITCKLRRKVGIVAKIQNAMKLPRGLKKCIDSREKTKNLQSELAKMDLLIHMNSLGKKRDDCWIKNVNTKKDNKHISSFHVAVGPVLVIAQCFCLMPVRGILAETPKGLSFKWLSFRTLYCLLYILTTIADTILTVMMVANNHKLDARNIEPFIFHISILMATFFFLHLAARWPTLMRKWAHVQHQIPIYMTLRERKKLSMRVKIVTIIFIMLSIIEHLLSIVSSIHIIHFCSPETNAVVSYLRNASSQIFIKFKYSLWLALLGKLQNVLLTFGWSYMDVFLMIIGIGLSSLFQQIQQNLERIKGESMPENFWIQTRRQYRLICELIEEVDAAISSIVMLSFANNLFFVCMQLLKSINKMPSVLHGIYFYFSLSFLLCRTLAVSLFLSEVHDRSRDPLLILRHVPNDSYTSEVERFVEEVANDVIALTGLKFFNVTRKLVLTVVGTIITYELVLIQFHEHENIWTCGH